MAHFTKDQYWGKALYAAKINMDNEKILLDAGLNEDEIGVLIDLSHTRHKLHSASSKSDELRDLYIKVGHQYSADETLVDKAKNKTSHDIRVFFYHVNKKYGTDFPDDVPEDL